MIGRARELTFPGLDDPAMSDLFSAELESAVDRPGGKWRMNK